ncbi:MAG: UDP-N-acetylmuramoyl-L-alanyl-D-glutamate--2,6-diaminopimelate ligase [Phycisphaerae bacterium]|nr:UDP-N-acetylmuramoyl-L-alanyl-D-glutamate--2,6-diaminopimelate ligase [Phycisphaerae bacterium]MBT5582931.1 UDP-N-acetylmuramoyl-L-alanyl-D-glutamate--2,6-diaminopimelate ligase [Phycisphaerae bacterium]MBT5656389.1 UDP-N-acetylmuramoyl-L-alanyl-D-glutamate--2,6-diaminopimelate ligase [Phycisphaerae bacterium]
MNRQSLGSLLEGLSSCPLRGAADCVPKRLVEDSRQVKAGDVFLARGGEAVDGRSFIAAAEASGAAVILSDEHGCSVASGPAIQSSALAYDGAVLAHRLAGDPSESLAVVGVTGTNGKTTVSTVLAGVLGGDGACGLLGGVYRDDGRTRQFTQLTTPMASEVAMWLSDSMAGGCTRAVMEVSSHALAQQRVAGVRYAAAIFTNLSGDHLDYHGSMEDYARAKRTLFDNLDHDAVAVVNADDPASEDMTAGTRASVIRCAIHNGGEVHGTILESNTGGSRVNLCSPWGERVLCVPFVGVHNVMNAMQVLAAACVLGVAFDDSCARLESAAAPPGRLERLNARLHVYVDFAHTDGALEAVLKSLREIIDPGAMLLVVVGCGGDRDQTKRPRMAAVATSLADRVWLTSDNPRTEDPDAILADMLTGVASDDTKRVQVEPDRRRAIYDAIAAAGPHDIVLIAGKGHERVQIIGAESMPFDDRKVAAEALKKAGWAT